MALPALGQRLVLVTLGGRALPLVPLLKEQEALFPFAGQRRENEFIHNLCFLGNDDPT